MLDVQQTQVPPKKARQSVCGLRVSWRAPLAILTAVAPGENACGGDSTSNKARRCLYGGPCVGWLRMYGDTYREEVEIDR